MVRTDGVQVLNFDGPQFVTRNASRQSQIGSARRPAALFSRPTGYNSLLPYPNNNLRAVTHPYTDTRSDCVSSFRTFESPEIGSQNALRTIDPDFRFAYYTARSRLCGRVSCVSKNKTRIQISALYLYFNGTRTIFSASSTLYYLVVPDGLGEEYFPRLMVKRLKLFRVVNIFGDQIPTVYLIWEILCSERFSIPN